MSEPNVENWAVVAATGTGQRMQSDRPKQYLTLGTKTILQQTLDNLLSYPGMHGVVLVLNQTDHHWSQLDYRHEKPVLLCTGGEHRFHSVYNGLQQLVKLKKKSAMVFIHDAVRPFVLHRDLDRLLLAALESDDGAILAAPVADTLKRVNRLNLIDGTQSREQLWRAFTPQCFRLEILLQALQSVIQKKQQVTDDASAMELLGYQPKVVKSDSRNIKITHPEDLQLARLLLQQFDPRAGR